MRAARPPTPHGLLTRLFLRQFLQNDLISPDADRAQLLAVVSASILSLTLFVSAVMSVGYIGPLLTPGMAAVLSLDDKFFYLAVGMIVTALVAAAQWDALTVDARDAAILEPLPVSIATIRRAKLTAVALVGLTAALAVNLWPSLVFPSLLVFTFKQMSLLSMLALIVTHAVVTVGASAFGFLTVVALRELVAAVLGPRAFARVSPWVQGALIVMLGGALLLLPAAASRIGERGFAGWRALSPPMWFLGVYEASAGGLIADLPRTPIGPRQAAADQIAALVYHNRRPQFPRLARRAGWAIAGVWAIAAAAYLLNARRLPSLAPVAPAAHRRRSGRPGRIANAVLLRHAAARAGFYFTLAAMGRSHVHRLTLACAAAAGLAMAVLALSSVEWHSGAASSRLLSTQPLLYGALLVGFRHVIRVPAELRASWGFQLAWRGREAAFVAGAKIAAVVALVLPALAVLLPLFAYTVGVRHALTHAALGLAGAVVLLEALMLTYDKVPFTCTYLPSENMKALAPIYVIAFVAGASLFARLQSDALQRSRALWLLGGLALAVAVLRIISARRVRLPEVQFDEVPATFQRLGLDA